MNTMAVGETGASITRLVARPAPTGPSSAGDDGPDGAVVKMTRRPGYAPAPGREAALHAGNPVLGGPTVLDPSAPERALVAEMSRKIAQAALEVLSGARSVQQLSRWLDTRCFSALTTRARLHATACQAERRHLSQTGGGANVVLLRHQPIVHSTHCSAVRPGIYETSVVIADKSRFRAIAMRFEETRGTWKVTALQIG
ncbi:hypothetical protein CVV68_02330 [Arthrobacter livingstonensis]|uniref:Uncharacterized protein n=1 Tax=Arthrobacter livingstonensis TaxID=670078 RepID=A0A2V5LCA0_9MICC|nr:Rv3235 family protein [Arthrobacter livingstonensis]PYI69265.1 hypothetical protein CVV68_02330 [Arthrobacter livingstonensis]